MVNVCDNASEAIKTERKHAIHELERYCSSFDLSQVISVVRGWETFLHGDFGNLRLKGLSHVTS